MNALKTRIQRVSETCLLLGFAAAALHAPHSFAASGTTSIDIDFPPLLILYYYNSIPITIDAASFSTATGMDAPAGCSTGAPGVECDVGAAAAPTLTSALGQITADADIISDAPAAALTTPISFHINNAWGVRSLVGGAGTLDATISQGAGDFVAGTATSDLAGTGGVTSSLTLTAGQNVGDLQFDVDLTALADPASASDTITITVVPTP